MLVTKPTGFLNQEDNYSTKRKFHQRYNHRNIPRNPVYGNQPNYDLRLVILRHAERVDHSLGQDWYDKVFGGVRSASTQAYKHPSLPQHLPYRSNTFLYICDPPITRDGEQQSYIKGQNLARVSAAADYCYTSPAARSVLTASAVLKGMNCGHVPMRLEPYLFEPMNWNSALILLDKLHPFLAKSDWIQTGYNIDQRYRRISNMLNPRETELDYYNRSHDFFDKIERAHGGKSPKYHGAPPRRRPTTILLVGHASSTAMFSTIALKQNFDAKLLGEQSANVPYLHAAVLERDAITRVWSLRSSSPYV